jgi:hypothetical protein
MSVALHSPQRWEGLAEDAGPCLGAMYSTRTRNARYRDNKVWGQRPWLCPSVLSDQLPALTKPSEAAEYLHTTALPAQDRYRWTDPKFINRGRRVLYRWSAFWSG